MDKRSVPEITAEIEALKPYNILLDEAVSFEVQQREFLRPNEYEILSQLIRDIEEARENIKMGINSPPVLAIDKLVEKFNQIIHFY